MKPGIITIDRLGHHHVLMLDRWFTANGLRHYVPEDARIIFTGSRLIIPTFDVERIGQARTNWAAGRSRVNSDGEWKIPIKIRTYRVRVPLGAIK